MVTYDLCFLICLIVFLFGVACGIVVGIKAEDKQRHNEKIFKEINDKEYENFIRSDTE